MEQRLDDYLTKLDRYAVEDGEADGLLGCWLCNRYFGPHLLVGGLLCPDCADVPGMQRIANVCRGHDKIIADLRREADEHQALIDQIKQAARRAVETISEGDKR